MEMLFSIDVSAIDIEQLHLNIHSSTLDDTTQEQVIVDSIFGIQNQLSSFIDMAEAYAEEIYANSSDTIYCKSNKIISSHVPTVEARNINLMVTGFDNTSGLITKSIIIDGYSDYYWRMGDYVEINNISIVPTSLNLTLDSIMTTEILDGFFLKDKPGELLSRCTTSFLYSVDILSEEVSNERAINYRDLNNLFFIKTDKIDIATKIIYAKSNIYKDTELILNSITAKSKIVATKIIAENGIVTLKQFNDDFLIAGGFIADNSSLDEEAETNTITLSGAVTELRTSYAPIANWSPIDLRKNDIKDSLFMDSFVDDIFENNAPEDISANHSIVCKEELVYCVEKIIDILSGLKVCEDVID